MSHNIRTATIRHNDPEVAERVKLGLRRDGALFHWVDTATEEDTEVSGKTVEEACQAAKSAWGGSVWDFQASWK